MNYAYVGISGGIARGWGQYPLHATVYRRKDTINKSANRVMKANLFQTAEILSIGLPS